MIEIVIFSYFVYCQSFTKSLKTVICRIVRHVTFDIVLVGLE